ncbi:hypothetical protein CCACVL1_07282 [Corchorus capsularis]|uniref:Uncharacterized protein n=1 Tax=Corchorus capsularis TaxID=210143 RepID=A0A1R3J7P3_COCAP|nr:hypothetical protein CCACVL1_07282 [Corchorus capsularis]
MDKMQETHSAAVVVKTANKRLAVTVQ